MKTLCLTAILLFISLTAEATPLSLSELLKMKAGSKLIDAGSTGETKEYSYEIISEKGNLKSLLIEFNQAQSSDKFLKANEQGHCLVQPRSKDILLNNLFFFKKGTSQRFSVNERSEVKSILIANFPDVTDNQVCLFRDLKKLNTTSHKLIKVKAHK